MKDNANDNYYPIGRVSQLLDEIYDLEVPERKVREAGMRILHNSACFKATNFLFRTRVKDFKVVLPCEYSTVVSVTGREVCDQWFRYQRGQTMLFQYFDPQNRRIEFPVGNPANPEAYINLPDFSEIDKEDVFVMIPSGLEILSKPHAYFEPFSLDGNVLTFNRTGIRVDVIFSTVLQDSFGFPLLSEKGIWALVQYMVYLDQLKKFYRKEGNANAVAAAREEYDRAAAQARSPELLTDNNLDTIMKTLTSKSRHKFGNPFPG